jgi:hypothetical protein
MRLEPAAADDWFASGAGVCYDAKRNELLYRAFGLEAAVPMRAILLAVCFCLACVPDSFSQTSGERRADDGVVRLDSNLVFTPAPHRDPLVLRLEENTARPLSTYLSNPKERFFGIERYKPSMLECTLTGAGAGLTYGLAAAAAGMSMGAWDESTGWYMAGAAALAGAVFGAKKADDAGFRVRIRWEPSQ